MAMTVTERKLPGEARSADDVMEDYRHYRSRLNPDNPLAITFARSMSR